MSLDKLLILIGIILILIDIFFASDLPTFVALLIFCYVFYRNLPFEILYKIILTILFFFVLLIIYIAVWRKIKTIVIDKGFAKDKYKAGVYGFPGQKGCVKIVDGSKYAMINGDLYAFYQEYPLSDGDVFIVKELKDGKIVIK